MVWSPNSLALVLVCGLPIRLFSVYLLLSFTHPQHSVLFTDLWDTLAVTIIKNNNNFLSKKYFSFTFITLQCSIKLNEWPIEDIIWYTGHEPKRNPQTRLVGLQKLISKFIIINNLLGA